MTKPITYVLLDRPDGEAFAADPALAASRGFVLTPEAAVPLLEKGLAPEEPPEHALRWANARATVGLQRFLDRQQVRLAEQSGLTSAGIFTLDRMLRYPAATGLRLWSLLKDKPRIAYRTEGNWQIANEPREAYLSLIKRICTRVPNHDFLPRERWIAPAMTLLAHAFALRDRLRGALVYNTIRKHFARFAGKVREQNGRLAQFGMEGIFQPGRGDVAKLGKSLFARAAGEAPRIMTGLDVAAYHRGEQAARQFLDSMEDALITPAVQAQQEAMVSRAGLTEAYASWLEKFFAWHKPQAVFLNGMSTGLNIALAQAGRRNKLPVLLVGHCSVGEGVFDSPLPKAALTSWYEDLCASPEADWQVVQSPHAEASSRAIDPSRRRIRVEPLIWGATRVKLKPKEEEDDFVVLHAGNFQPWQYYLPFSSECSLEYVQKIVELAEAISQVPRMKLVIRMKPGHEHKTECLEESVQARLAGYSQVHFSKEKSFYDDLAGADLLMSSTSTVIEEALLNRVPVLLRSGWGVKPFLPANAACPTQQSRGAVYTVNSAPELPAMLRGIQQAHFRKPLTDEELRPHCYGSEAMSLGQFADVLARAKNQDLSSSLAALASSELHL